MPAADPGAGGDQQSDDLIAQNFAKLMAAHQQNGQMAIRRVTTAPTSDAALQPVPDRARKLTQYGTGGVGKVRSQQADAPRFGGRRPAKALVDIEMDADSDLEEFERHN